MQITHFSVTNFRSIKEAKKIPISKSTVICGPNNEGKSNILNALAIAMNEINAVARQLDNLSRKRRRTLGRNIRQTNENLYVWERDYPLDKQNAKNAKQGRTTFRIAFQFDEDDLEEFQEHFGSRINGQLEFEISVNYLNNPDFNVIKRGPHNRKLASNKNQIAQFVGNKLQVNYIPAVRTESDSLGVIRKMASERLKKLEEDQTYLAAMETIRSLQQPILDELSDNITKTMSGFLPQVTEVKVSGVGIERLRQLSEPDVYINDGNLTHISQKGDGIKSLAAISLMHRVGEERTGSTVLLVEEPETHLHSGAIHRLKHVLDEISDTQQVILTTHHPIFANRIDVDGNVIVRGNRARPAKKISDVRDALGVRASENLQNANLVLLVEGEDDKIILDSILPQMSSKLKGAIQEGVLVIEPTRSASKLSFNVEYYSKSVCDVVAVVDNDEAGDKAAKSVVDENKLSSKDVFKLTCKGNKESEIEDCFSIDSYKESVEKGFGVSLEVKEFRSACKWSDRVKECFHRQSKVWSQKMEARVKSVVASEISKRGASALADVKGEPVWNLVKGLEKKINEMSV